MQRITTFLWYNDQAEEAAKYYTSVFKNSRITGIAKPEKARRVMDVVMRSVKLNVKEIEEA